MSFPARCTGWFYAVLILCPAGGAVLAHSCDVETRRQVANTRESIEEPHANLPLAVLLCGSAGLDAGAPGLGSSCAVAWGAPANDELDMPLWSEDGVGDRFAEVDLALDERPIHVGAPIRAGDGKGEPSAVRPARTLVWRRRSARRPPPADVDSSALPPAGEMKWAVWGGLTAAAASPVELERAGAAPAVEGKPRQGAMRGAGHGERKRAMERIGGVPQVVVDAVASGGVPIYRPIGSPGGVGIVLKPQWRGVALSAVFEIDAE